MKLALSGVIKGVKKLTYKRETCYGITRAYRDKFRILISEKAVQDDCFAETILHELLHLWFFIISALGIRIPTENEQHEILETVVPTILSRTQLILKRKKKKS